MNSPFATRKLLTIVCEAGLETAVLDDLRSHGIKGYTLTEARGQGEHGRRDGLWPSSSNIRVEILCDEATAAAFARHLQEQYYRTYGMVCFIADVQILRPEKFQSGAG